MVAGADSIDDMALLRHGGMGTVFDRPYAPVDVGVVPAGVHLRSCPPTRRRRVPPAGATAARTPLLAGIDGPVMVDIDDTIIEVHGYAKQGSGYGYSGVRGPERADRHGHHRTRRTGDHRPTPPQRRVRLPTRRGPDDRRHPGHRDTAALAPRPPASRWCGRIPRSTATPPWPRRSAAAPTCRSPCAWTRRSRPPSPPSARTPGPRSSTPTPSTTKPPDQWISRAEVAEIGFTAFSSRKAAEQVAGPAGGAPHPRPQPRTGDGQQTLFDTWRFHAFFTTTDLDTVTADKTHRGHAIIEQVHADLKDSALAHLPSGRSPPTPPGWCWPSSRSTSPAPPPPSPGPRLAKARTATIRRTLITVPARIASSARRLTLHLPQDWPWEPAWNTLFNNLFHRHQPLIT